MKTLLLSFCTVLPGYNCFFQTKEVPFTLDDRDRIMRAEQKLESLHKEMNVKIDSLFRILMFIIFGRFLAD